MAFRGRSIVWSALVLALLLGTAVSAPATPSPAPTSAEPASGGCAHPYPCAGDWPDGLGGPFPLDRVDYVRVASFDGVELEGWIGFPRLPAGVRAPVALHSIPYLGYCPTLPYPERLETGCRETPSDPAWWTDEPPRRAAFYTWDIPPIDLVRRGFAAAFFSVRGTGNSGGCFGLMSDAEQRDQVFLVNWLAAQPWSNGRVGMGGVSYAAGTAFEAAIHAPPALKTIVVGGVMTDLYTYHFTPQGAPMSNAMTHWPRWITATSILPPAGGGAAHLAAHARYVPERACADVVDVHETVLTDPFRSRRDAAFYAERSQMAKLDNVTSAVLLAQGFHDEASHVFQESLLWNALTNAPKRMIEGPWGHEFPTPDVAQLDPSWSQDTWRDLLLSWLDFWLKGVGPRPEGLDGVQYQPEGASWRQSTAWPPAEARDEAMYLVSGGLSPKPQAASASFRPVTSILNEYKGAQNTGFPFNSWPALCGPSNGGMALAFLSPPLKQDLTIAGNPFAYLTITSDQPGGRFAVHLLRVPEAFRCGRAEASQIDVLAMGAIDLRFHEGNLVAGDFPVGTPTAVRVDLWDFAERVTAGDRLAVVVSGGEIVPIGWGIAPSSYLPRITLHGAADGHASHVVLPIVEGTLGGAPTTVSYPPRPFAS